MSMLPVLALTALLMVHGQSLNSAQIKAGALGGMGERERERRVAVAVIPVIVKRH